MAIEYLDESSRSGATHVLAHGFTQNARCLRPFATHLDAALRAKDVDPVVAMIDAPGHGASQHDDADLIDAATLLVEAGGPAHYIGYSMGGRMLLHAAILFPESVHSLTLVGATAGIDSSVDRASRATNDARLARRLERDGLEAFLDHWLSLELFATLPEEAAGRSERLVNRPEGLAASLRSCGAGNQFPLWSRLSEIEAPVLVIAGAADTKFTEIGHRMVEALPKGRFAAVEGGHAVHSEQPEAVADLIAEHTALVSVDASPDGS